MQALNEDHRPGYPLDRRPMSKVARAHDGPVGDFELAAARVVARLTGELVMLQDDGHRDATVDIRIEYPDGHQGYIEVWTDMDSGYAATYSELRKREGRLPRELRIGTLRRDWFLTLSERSKVRGLEAELDVLLARLEAGKAVFEYATEHETLGLSSDPSVRRLLDLGVVMLASRPASSVEHGVVRLYPRGVSGPSEVAWKPVLGWLRSTLVSPRLTDVRSKLRRTGADERHAFLGVTFSSPGEVFFALGLEEQSLPSEPPLLPEEITHLWLMQAPSLGRCLAWFPDRGWLDCMRHWVTD